MARRRDESGQTLILALGFLACFGLIVAALLNYATGSLRSSSSLEDLRSAQFAADGAVDSAITRARFDTSSTHTIEAGAGCLSATTINGQSIYVDCSRSVDTTGYVSTVTMLACRSGLSSCTANSAVLRAVVEINRSPLPGCPTTPTATRPDCMPTTVKSWSVKR